MKRSRFSEAQIIGILKDHAAGMGASELCHKHGISAATFYKWRRKYGGMEVADAKRLKALEAENAKLKKMLAGHPENPGYESLSDLIHPETVLLSFEGQGTEARQALVSELQSRTGLEIVEEIVARNDEAILLRFTADD
jgi:putative transposase